MVVLGGRRFLMNEVPLYHARAPQEVTKSQPPLQFSQVNAVTRDGPTAIYPLQQSGVAESFRLVQPRILAVVFDRLFYRIHKTRYNKWIT